MKRCTNVIIAVLLVGFDSAAGGEVLDLQEALQLVRQKNLVLLMQAESRAYAELEEEVHRTARLPSLDFAFSTSYVSKVNQIDLRRATGIPNARVRLGGHDRSEFALGVRQPLFTGFALTSKEDLARLATLEQETRQEVLTNEVIHGVCILFYTSRKLTSQEKILDASLDRLHVVMRNVRNLFDAAQVMAFDTLQVHNQALAVEIEREDLRRRQRLVALQLARLLNLPERPELAAIAVATTTEEVEGLDVLHERALAKRPELHQVRLVQQTADLQKKLARAAYFPAVYAQGSWHYAKPGLDPVRDEWMNYFSAGVGLEWNLWRWGGDQKRVEQTIVRRRQLTLEEQEQINRIEFEVSEARENLLFSRKQLGLAERLAQQERERYRIVVSQHESGVVSTNDLTTAEIDLTRAELQVEQARIQYQVYLADLRKAVGSIAEQN